jgi:hypothetical protein
VARQSRLESGATLVSSARPSRIVMASDFRLQKTGVSLRSLIAGPIAGARPIAAAARTAAAGAAARPIGARSAAARLTGSRAVPSRPVVAGTAWPVHAGSVSWRSAPAAPTAGTAPAARPRRQRKSHRYQPGPRHPLKYQR